MSIRVIRGTESLDSVWEELVFTEARLLGDVNAQGFAPTVAALLTRLEQVRGGQLSAWREEVTAEAGVAAQDYRLDNWVRGFDLALLSAVENTQSPRYKRYFKAQPSRIIRLGLASELSRVRSWVESLTTEPEAMLKEMGTQLKSIVADSDEALERRRRAATTRADHRVREITSLLEDVNGARASLYGALMQKATEVHLPRDWPNQFFRHTSRVPRTQTAQPEPTPAVANPPSAPQRTSNGNPGTP